MAKLSDIKLNRYEGTEIRDTAEQNVGNPIEYVATKAAQGFTRSIEGMVDFVSGIGPGIYGAISGNEGAKDFAKNVFTTDWFDYSAVDKQYNPSAGMQFVGEVASGIGNSLPSLLTAGAAGVASGLTGLSLSEATLRGISLTALGYSATGNAIGEAINKTGEFGGKELGYGLLSGLTEVGTEAIGDALGLGTGRVMKSMAGRFATDATEAISKSTAWGIVKSLGGDFLGEGFEEGLSAILEPAWGRITGVDPNAEWNWGDIGYQALIGGLSGVMMGAAQGQIDAGRSIYYGKKAMAEGKTDRILDVTRNILENGKTIGVSDKILETVQDNYDQYMGAVAKANGKTTVRQQMLLGNLTKLNTAAMINPLLQKEALNILQNAEAVAEQYSAFMKDSEGNPVKLTAADIRKGVNLKETNQKTLNKQIRDALMNNQKLQGIAIMSFAGKLYMQTDAWVKYAAENPGAVTDNTLSQFIETASEAEKAELGRMLGIQDWNKVSAIEVNRAFERNSDTIQKAISSAESAKAAAKGERNAAPNRFTKKAKDGAYDLGDGYVVVKSGDSYRVYNEQKDTVTRELSARDVNALMNQKVQETAQNEENETVAKADEVARRVVPDYDKLSESVKRSVRMTIRQAAEYKVSTADMELSAKLSAKSGLNIVFSRDELALNKRDSKGNLLYANGQYNMRNTIYLNPDLSQIGKTGNIMLHELGHWLYNNGGNKIAMLHYATAALEDSKYNKVVQQYVDFYKSMGETEEQYAEKVFDEIQAAYAEELMTDDDFWNKLLADDPKLKRRVPAFMRKWADRMDMKQAKTAAEAYSKIYQDAFRRLSSLNQGSNAFEYSKKKDGSTEFRMSLASYFFSGRKDLYKYMVNQYGKDDAKQTIEAFDDIARVAQNMIKNNPDLQLFSNWSDTNIEFDENGHPIFSTSVKNGEYELNQDFSRVCKKRRHLDMVLNYLATNDNFRAENLKKSDFLKINRAIKAHGFEIACDLCFVDAKRYRQAEWAKTFTETYNDILKSVIVGDTSNFDFINGVMPSDDGVQIDPNKPVTFRKWEEGRVKETVHYDSLDDLIKNEGNANDVNIAKLIRDNPELRHWFVAKDIISSNGFDNIQRANQKLRGILDGWGGSSVPKPSAGDTVYDNSVLLQGKYKPETAFAMGGMRMNSFSDFMAHMFFDYCQAFADAEAKGLPIQAYTKELLFIRLYGKTGGKFNMSGIPAVMEGLSEKNEAQSAGLDIRRLAEHLGKDINEVTEQEILDNLDYCDYVWAKESINMDNAILLQSGILYDRLTSTQKRKALNAIREGNFDQAFAIAGEENVDREYAKHCGTIVVGVSKAHILKLLRDNTIRMVIPYHKSGLNPEIAKLMHISAYADYTKKQNTSSLKKGKDEAISLTSKKIPAKYKIKDFDFYEFFGKTIDGVLYDGKRTAQAYLDWCDKGRFDKALNKYVYDLTDGGLITADELHKEYRVVPKFEEFRREENYYKVLEDFDVYDTITNKHSPQEAIHFLQNGSALPEDYKKILLDALKAEQKDITDFEDELYNNVNGLQDEIMKISKKAFDRSEARLSLPDQEYMKAVESSDMEEAQKFVDEAAKKAGYTIKAFHGTANGGNFTVFDPKKLNNSKLSSHIGQGFYFTNDKEAAKEYTKQVDIYGRTRNGENPHLFEGYIKLQNPIEVTPSSHNLRFDQVKSIVADGDNKWFFDKGIAHDIQNKEINDRTYSREELSKMSKDELIDLYVRYIMRFGDMATLQSMVDAYSYGNQDKLLDAMKRYTGHDGIHWNMREGLDQFVVFDSSQFKDSSPVTYDDQGNVIPLSERFNDQNEDIRYSIPDVEYMQAIEDADNDRAREILDEQAKKAGYTLLATHRTDADFTVFDKGSRSGRNGKTLGDAFYVAKTQKEWEGTPIHTMYDTDTYGKNRMLLYVNPGKTLDLKNGLSESEANRVYDKYFAPFHEDKFGIYRPHVIDKLQEPSRLVDYIEEAAKNRDTTTDEVFKWLGYNSVKDGIQYALFDANQMKSADLVTYEDNEKIIPPSERFNPNNDDIRWSIPDVDYMQAVNDGDTEAAQRMVDEAAERAGFSTEHLYHGTDSFGFTRPDVNAPGGDGFSFWATDSKATASSYTEYGEVRGITEELTEESLEKLTAKAEEDIDDEISHFCSLIDKYFSEWFFGYDGGESYVKEIVFGANPEAGYGNGVYDKLVDLVIDAYDQYGDQYNYEEFYEFQEDSKEFEEIERSIVTLEGLYRRYNALANKNYDELVGGIYQLYGNTDGFYVVEGNGADWNNLPHEGLPKISRYGVEDAAYSTRDYSLWARDNGYKGILFKNIHDNGRYGLSGIGNVYAFFEPLSQVRSADPVTYDDQGNVIPLSERFNTKKDDFRWSLPEDDLKEAKRIKKLAEQQSERATERLQKSKEIVKDNTAANKATNRVLDLAQKLKEYVTKRKYVSSSVLANPLLDAWAKELGKLKYRSDIRKASARKILVGFSQFYNKNNDVLTDYYKSMNQEMDANVLGALELIKNNIADKNVNFKPLSLEELQAAEVILGAADALFRNFDTVVIDGKRELTQTLAEQEIEILQSGDPKEYKKFVKAMLLAQKLNNATDPRAVIKWLEHYDENGILTKLFKSITDGETASMKQNVVFMTPFEDFLKKHKKYSKRLAETKIALEAISGQVNLTVGQAIALYELTKREQAQRGLVESGVSFADDNGLTKSARFFGEGKYSEEEIKKYAEQIRDKVAKHLTAEDMEFIGLVEDFFNNQSKAVKTEADMELYGYTNALEDFYYPIKRAASTIATSFSNVQSLMADIAAMNTFSFNKDTVKNARNQLYLNSVYDTVQQHARLMSVYANMYKALEAFSRVMNRNIGTSTEVTSVRKYLQEHVWADSETYLKKLMADIQGVKNEQLGDKLWGGLRGAFAKAQLGANLKVIFAQTASLPTAMTRLSPSSIAYGITHKVNFKDLDRYSDWAMVRNHEQAIVKAEGVVDKVGKVGDMLSKPIQWTDRLTIGLLWNACQAEVKKTKGLEIGTEENKIEAAKLLESVGRDTQPNYTNTERSGMMRGNQFLKTLTMFTSAPLKQVSRFLEAAGEFSYALKTKNKTKIHVAGKKLRKTLAAILLANMMYCLIGQFFTWLYKKDRKNKAGKEISFAQDYFTDVAGTTIGMFPVAKSVFDYFNKGYDLSSFDFDIINDILNTTGDIVGLVEKAASGEQVERSDFGSALRSTVYSASQLAGIPTKNVMNTVTGLFKRFDPEVAYGLDSFFYGQDYRKDLNAYVAEGNEKMSNLLMDLYTKENTGTMSKDAQKTLLNLYTQGYDVLPKSIGNKISYSYKDENGDTQTESFTLNAQQKKQFKAIYSEATPVIEAMLDSKAFQKLSEENQAKAIRSVNNAYYIKAKNAVTDTATANSLLTYFPKDTGKYATILAGLSDVTADTDKKGNVINGTKKQNVYKYLTSNGLTKNEALYVMAVKGYSLKNLPVSEANARKMLLKYILSLPVSQSEKAAIAEHCGFTVKGNRIISKNG